MELGGAGGGGGAEAGEPQGRSAGPRPQEARRAQGDPAPRWCPTPPSTAVTV
jgi:hypothetical protein